MSTSTQTPKPTQVPRQGAVGLVRSPQARRLFPWVLGAVGLLAAATVAVMAARELGSRHSKSGSTSQWSTLTASLPSRYA